MTFVIAHAASEPTRALEQFGIAAHVFFGFRGGGILLGDQLEQNAFANTDAGNEERAQAEPFCQGCENNRGDGDHFSAVLTNTEGTHARGYIKILQLPRLIFSRRVLIVGIRPALGPAASRTSASAFPPQATPIPRVSFGADGTALRNSAKIWWRRRRRLSSSITPSIL